jgi:hypothetical protein
MIKLLVFGILAITVAVAQVSSLRVNLTNLLFIIILAKKLCMQRVDRCRIERP